MNLPILSSIATALFFGILAIIISIKEEKTVKFLLEQVKKHKNRIYQIAVLKEIQDRIGYSLNQEKVIDVITQSLKNLIPHSTVSSMIIRDNSLIFKTYLEESVSNSFIQEVGKTMLASLRELVGHIPLNIDTQIFGATLNDINPQGLASFFHIPLVISDKVVGLVNVSSVWPNLYKEEEMTILYQIAGQASNALSRLDQVLMSQKNKLESVIENEKNRADLKDDFTNMIIHELRAPVTAIKDSSDLIISNKYDLQESEKKQFLEIINRQAKLLLAEIESILDSAKLEAGKFTITKARADLGNIIKEHIAIFLGSAKKKNISLILDLNPNLPTLSVDKTRIGQVMNNLLSNSIKFTKDGGRIEVVVRHNSLDRFVTVSVRDTGVGIPKAYQKDLFSKFSQVNNGPPKLAKEGTGLGLYVVKGIIEAHGGTVSLQSETGNGTTISFTLPIPKEEMINPRGLN